MAIIAMQSAATGLRALSTQLDVISNNIANANNDGFKASRANFEDLLYDTQQQPGLKDEQNDISPVGIQIGYGTRISGTQIDMTQGSTVVTGGSMDAAIQGDGFFRVKLPDGQGDGFGYTRTGKFMENADGEFVLSPSNGYRLDPPIKVPSGTTSVSISTDGRVFYTTATSTQPQSAGQIQLAKFVNPQGLIQIGGNIYQKSDASGEATLANPGLEGTGSLQSGAVEASNVDPVTELVNLIKTQRTFELNSQSIQAADQMLQGINNLRR